MAFGSRTEPAYTEAELAFYRRAETHRWWEAASGKGQEIIGRGYWECRKSGQRLVALNEGRIPNVTDTDALDLHAPTPVLQGQASGLPPDGLISDADALPTGDLTLWAVSKSGTSSGAMLMSLVGDAGGTLGIRQRSGDLVQVMQRLTSTTQGIRLQQTLSGSDFHLVQFVYDHATGVMSLMADGVLLAGGSPSDGTYEGYAHPFATSRLAVLTEYDETWGDQGQPARNLEIAACGVATTTPDKSTDWQAALIAMVGEKYPSLGLV